MGCDIHWTFEGGDPADHKVLDEVLGFRWYRFFAWLGGVRDDWHVKPIAAYRGVPDDAPPAYFALLDYRSGHSHSWVSADELAAVDYDAPITADFGNGGVETGPLRDFIGRERADALASLGARGVTRALFWFDS